MSFDDIRPFLAAQPFVPFEIVATDGTRYRITHPDGVRATRTSVQLVLPDTPDKSRDRFVVLAMIHIMRLGQLVERE
jgi:hypothetical protein